MDFLQHYYSSDFSLDHFIFAYLVLYPLLSYILYAIRRTLVYCCYLRFGSYSYFTLSLADLRSTACFLIVASGSNCDQAKILSRLMREILYFTRVFVATPAVLFPHVWSPMSFRKNSQFCMRLWCEKLPRRLSGAGSIKCARGCTITTQNASIWCYFCSKCAHFCRFLLVSCIFFTLPVRLIRHLRRVLIFSPGLLRRSSMQK
jgi:hypothetical protein